MIRTLMFLILISNLTSNVLNIEAKDFGVKGQTFKIAEEGFEAMIQRRLAKVDMDKMQELVKNKVQKKLQRPPGVSLPRTIKPRSFIYDPTFVLKEDIVKPDGSLLYAKGTKVNPLEIARLTKKLIFIDGDDKAQVVWFKEFQKNSKDKEHKKDKENNDNKEDQPEDKIILIQGSPLDLIQELGQEVYFDQQQELISKFGIKQVPAVLEQEGNMIRITECKV
jgi:conjugal transfer pilus assembly protein TraW